jgi:hypothetical protein
LRTIEGDEHVAAVAGNSGQLAKVPGGRAAAEHELHRDVHAVAVGVVVRIATGGVGGFPSVIGGGSVVSELELGVSSGSLELKVGMGESITGVPVMVVAVISR